MVRPQKHKSPKDKITDDKKIYTLILYNDNVNTFDFVIETLVEVCNHSYEQAEQCALITHFKGKCEIKTGSYDYLSKLKNTINNKGLKSTIY